MKSPVYNVPVSAPAAKQEVAKKDAKGPFASVPPAIKVRGDQMLAVMKEMQAKLLTVIRDPKFKVTSYSAGGGAITIGAVGGGLGTTAGALMGGAVGVVPALFTFGLSIPAGAVVGGTIGGATGITLGAGTGFVGGGVLGNTAYAYRVEIKEKAVVVKAKVVEIGNLATAKVTDKTQDAKKALYSCIKYVQKTANNKVDVVRYQAAKASEKAALKASELKARAKTVASDKGVQVVAASAVGGSVVLGTTGLATGTAVGAAVGVVPALFTFGLSIPVGAMIGGSIGATTGGTVGFGTGGALGYGAYTKRKEIGSAASSVNGYLQNMKGSAKVYVQGKAKDATEAVNTVKSKIRGSTGTTI